MADSSSYTSNAFALPRLRATIKGSQFTPFWDVRFYPYLTHKDDPSIFAVVGSHGVLLCQATDEETTGVRVLDTYLKDENHRTETDRINSGTWCYIEDKQNEPLFAVAGETGQIQVLSIMEGGLKHTLVGHGIGVINDLATHPKYPWIIASASLDSSVCIWDLRRASTSTLSSCIIICGMSLAHSDGILSISWHDTGCYLLSSGFDHRICVWTIPDLSKSSNFWQSISKEQRKRSVQEVHTIYYPHFITSALHNDYVDKVVWYGDLILSKAPAPPGRRAEEKIVLWSITGFNSTLPPPTPATAPKTQEHLETRNGFMRSTPVHMHDDTLAGLDRHKHIPPYQKCVEFRSPSCPSFYIRFGLLKPSELFPEIHPILTIGNAASEIRHWDLTTIALGYDGQPRANGINIPKKPSKYHNRPGIARKAVHKSHSSSSNRHGLDEILTPDESIPSSRASSEATGSSIPVPSVSISEPSLSTEATSLASDPSALTDDGNPLLDRARFPLDDPYEPLKEGRKDTLPDYKIKGSYFIARACDWSLCGRWCVVVGEARGQQSGVIAVLDR